MKLFDEDIPIIFEEWQNIHNNKMVRGYTCISFMNKYGVWSEAIVNIEIQQDEVVNSKLFLKKQIKKTLINALSGKISLPNGSLAVGFYITEENKKGRLSSTWGF